MDDLGEKTEAPTPKRLREAREKGQVPKSQDLSGVILLGGALVLIIVMAPMIGEMFASITRRALTGSLASGPLTVDSMRVGAYLGFGEIARIMVPVLLITMLIAYLSQFVQIGAVLASDPITPKLDRLSPIQGVKRIYGRRGLMKALINTLKLALLIVVSVLVIGAQLSTVASLPRLPAAHAAMTVARLALLIAFTLLAVLLILAIIDLIYQRWQHEQDNKMTKQQVKDERKTMEGDPQLKGRRLQMGREIVMQQIGASVPDADVIVTNPTHFSVAIKYDPDAMSAPRVTAKGADLVALRIRQLARTNDVPIVERAPLARALYWGVRVGQEIAHEHYEAVAEILAYVYRLDEGAAARGFAGGATSGGATSGGAPIGERETAHAGGGE